MFFLNFQSQKHNLTPKAEFLDALLKHAKKQGGIALASVIYALLSAQKIPEDSDRKTDNNDSVSSQNSHKTVFDIIYHPDYNHIIFSHPKILKSTINSYMKYSNQEGDWEFKVWKCLAELNDIEEITDDNVKKLLNGFLSSLPSSPLIDQRENEQVARIRLLYRMLIHLYDKTNTEPILYSFEDGNLSDQSTSNSEYWNLID